MTGVQFLAKVKELSPDIEFIIMTSHANLETAVEGMKLGAFDYIYKPFESLTSVVTTCDRAIERVYMKMENEQLLEELAGKNQLLATVNQRMAQENKEIQFINGLMQKLALTADPDGVLQTLIDGISTIIGDRPVLYFKYLPAYVSLVVGLSTKIPIDGLRTVGISLEKYDLKEIPNLFQNPKDLTQLKDLMQDIFKVSQFHVVPFIHKNQPLGLIVLFNQTLDGAMEKLIQSFLQISYVSYDNAILATRIRDMAVKDPLTTLYNRRYFNEKLDEEINRCRRTHHPLSLIYLDIDHFKKYNDTNGHPMGDVIIKSVAQILLKTSRKTDVVSRLGGEEFAVLCPHTPGVGAAIKAEKIRLTVENTKFPNGDMQPLGKVSVSLGVSEFPSIVGDAESLIRSADDALYKVKQGGRNRVCLAESAPGFRPEFNPVKVPGPPSERGKTGTGEK